MLAGRPKLGKSWLMLDIALAVAGGRIFVPSGATARIGFKGFRVQGFTGPLTIEEGGVGGDPMVGGDGSYVR